MTTKAIRGRDAAILRTIDRWRERADRLEATSWISAHQIRLCANDLQKLVGQADQLEIWRDIPGHPGHQVSSLGALRQAPKDE